MTIATTPQPVSRKRKSASVRSIWQAIKRQLETKRAAIRDEIASYPRPITACDAQFNYLLDERNNVAQELRSVETALQVEETGHAAVRRIETFLSGSRYIQGADAGAVRNSLAALAADGNR